MKWPRCEVTGKVRFSDVGRAEAALQRFREMNKNRKFNSPERYYLCDHCDMYHLTHYKTAPYTLGKREEVIEPVDESAVTDRLNFLLEKRK